MDDQHLIKVKQFYFRYKRLPSFEEMKKLFNFVSKSSVSYTVDKWIKKSIVQRVGNRLAPAANFFQLPLLGSIKAGSPTTEETYDYESVSLDQYLVGNPGFTYLLRVSGDSMINASIRPGDLVIIDKKREPRNNDIIAAFIDNEWTLKYYKNEDGKIYLEAANPNYQPIFPKENLATGGVVVSVIRKFY